MAKEKPLTETDFGELAKSENFTAAIIKLNTNLDAVKAHFEALGKCDVEKLSVKDQVVLDLYLAYAVNSLYWMFLRTKGIHPASHAIKSEINRVRECFGRAKIVCCRKKPTKRLNKEAAKRFIRSGLWKPGDKPVGGVIKKFGSTNVDVKASSSSSQANEKVAEATLFKVPRSHANMGRVVKKFDSISVGEVSLSFVSSKINEKDDETKFKSPNRKPEGGFNKFNSTNVGASSSFSQGNKKGGEMKQLNSPHGNASVFNKANSTNVGASSSFSQGNNKGGETKQFNSPHGNVGVFNKANSTNVGASSSFSQGNKKGGETKQFNSPNRKPEGGFNKFNSTNAGASSSFSQGNKKGGETKQFNSSNWKTGKKSNHNPYKYTKN